MGLPESLGEVAHFLEAAGGGDGGDGLLGGCEQSGGFLEAVLSQVADRCRPDDMFEAAEAFALAYEGASCDPPDVELLGAVAVDVRQHLFEPFLFPQGSWGGAALPGGRLACRRYRKSDNAFRTENSKPGGSSEQER